ncbi:hypothetical protein D047_4805B, partial [Vibrio parahaemolyticus VPTS-2010_2]
PTR